MNFDEMYDAWERSYIDREEPEDMALEAPETDSAATEGQRPIMPAGEVANTLASAVAGSVPAGLAGLWELITTGDLDAAVKEIERIQGELTVLPETEEGMAALDSTTEVLEKLGAPAEWLGEKTLEVTGSPGAATAAEIIGDPLNFIPGAAAVRVARSAAKKSGKKLDIDTPEDLMPLQVDEATRKKIDPSAFQTESELNALLSYRKEIRALEEKYKNDPAYAVYYKTPAEGGDVHRGAARIVDDHFDELSPELQEYFIKDAPMFEFEGDAEITPGFKKGIWQTGDSVRGGHIWSIDEGIAQLTDKLYESGAQQIDVPAVQTQRPLEKASEQFKAGLISGEEAVAAMDDVIRQREMAASARAWNQAQKGRARGARFVRSKIDDAVRKGEVDPDAADVALWALNKNPSIADDLGISITKRPEGSMAAGAYNSAGRIVKLFKGEGNPTTAIHEVLHHSEKMLPPSLRNPIADLWKKRLSAAVNEARKSGDIERAELLLKQAAVRRGKVVDPELQQEIMEAYASGKLNKTRDYQFTNPSEFWAENAANIISGKFGNQGKWVAQAKDYMNELLEHIKAKLGLDSNDALYKGVKQVLSGQQLQKGTMIAESEKGLSAVQQFLQDPSMAGTVPDLMKVQEQILRGAK